MKTAIVNFRTMKNGGYKWIKRGQRRGYWRVLIVRDPRGCTRETSRNVISVAYEGPQGIDGIGERSAYRIAPDLAQEVARAENARQLGEWRASVASAEGDAQELGDIYNRLIGYDIFADAPDITPTEVSAFLLGYLAEWAQSVGLE